MVVRCGRRFGKTQFAMSWILDGVLKSMECAWFAPQHMFSAEVFAEIEQRLGDLVTTA